MTRYILILSLFIYSAQAKVIIISDIDDTLRVVNTANKKEAIGRLLTGIKPFGAMRELLWATKEMYEAQGEEVVFHYVSASYRIMYNPTRWLEKNDFPTGKAVQKKIAQRQSILEYKISVVSDIIEQVDRIDQIYMFGDSGQFDAKAYQTVKQKMDLTNSSIFIRDLGNPNIEYLKDAKYFLTANQLLDSEPFSKLPSHRKQSIESKSILADFVVENLILRNCQPPTSKCIESLLGNLMRTDSRRSCTSLLLLLWAP